MLVVFFDVHGIFHVKFLPQVQTINPNVCKDILRRLMRSVKEKRIVGDELWLLHHDNAPAHNAFSIGKFLAKNIAMLGQPPYSSDLAPCDLSSKESSKLVFKTRQPLQ